MMLKRIDLTRDYQKHKKEYLAAIEAVCEETAFSGGKFADQFDNEFAAFCGVPYAAGVNNGTSALHCAMLALGIGEGDEVIVPANTYIATAWGVTYTGATPVFVDCTSDTWEIDPDKIEEKITDRTRAILGVHLYGQPFEFRKVKAIADKYGLFVVEDCAQAHGAEYEGKLVGSLGELGCFSFYPGKNLYAFGEGGSVTCYKKEYYDAITTLKNQGCEVRYYHDVVGYNYRLEGLQGAVFERKFEIPAGMDEAAQRDWQAVFERNYQSRDYHAGPSGEHQSGVSLICDHSKGPSRFHYLYGAEGDGVQSALSGALPSAESLCKPRLSGRGLPQCGISGKSLCDAASFPGDDRGRGKDGDRGL